MEKKIEQYLPLYLGQKFRYRYVDWEKDSWSPWTILNGRGIDKMQDLSIDKIQLQLRSLSSMTEEERKELEATKTMQRASPVHPLAIMVWTAESYLWAFKNGFDVFQLKEAGLAIYEMNDKPETV